MRERVAITDLAAYPVRHPASRQEWLVVEIRTGASVSGWGEAVARPDGTAASRAINACKPRLIGMDATATESVSKELEDLQRQHRMAAGSVQGAINMALLDVMGQLAKAPVYQILGGPTRNKARALAPLQGTDTAQLLASFNERMQAGFRSISVPLMRPTGLTRGRGFYREVRRLLEQMRSMSDQEVDFVLNCNGQLTPAEATVLARELETFHLLWLDEPCHAVQNEAMLGVSEETVTPIGTGRAVLAKKAFQDWLRMGAVDVLRPDICRWGITPLKKLAAMAETYYVAVAPTHTGGPIGTAAALQVAASIPNFFLLEIPRPRRAEDQHIRSELVGVELENVQDGFLALPTGPGLGLQVNRDVLERYTVTT